MTDTIIKGTGNSRSLRTVPTALTEYQTTQDMLQAMINGTFPIDIGPLNPLGLSQIGTPLDAAHLYGKEVGTYKGTGQGGSNYPVSLTFQSVPELIIVFSTTVGIGLISPSYKKGTTFCRMNNTELWITQLNIEVNNKTVSWSYSTFDNSTYAMLQLNSNAAYYYFAFL